MKIQQFLVGDVIRKENGKNSCEVIQQNGYSVRIRWNHNQKEQLIYTSQNRSNWVYADKEGTTNQMNILFEISIDGSTKIAEKLLEKSNKEWIMQVKGSGEIHVLNPKDIKEIVPYTIEVNINGQSQHYQADVDKYKVDDVFVMGKTLQIARVVKLDTKNKQARNTFKPFAKLIVDTEIE